MIKKYILAALSPLLTTGYSYFYTPSAIDCARLSHVVYHDEPDTQLTQHGLHNYDLLETIDRSDMGMRACVFRRKKTNNIVVAFRGTQLNNSANLLIDIGIAASALECTQANSHFVAQHAKFWFQKYCNALLNTISNSTFSYVPTNLALMLLDRWGWNISTAKKYKQKSIETAFEVFEYIKKNYGSARYYLTGHSLGGFYAQLIGYHYGHTTYTYNAPGAYQAYRQLHPRWNRALWWIRSKQLISNLIRDHDLVGTFGTHLGKTHIIPNKEAPKENLPDEPGYLDTFWLLYDLPSYIHKNHTISHVIEDLVAQQAQA